MARQGWGRHSTVATGSDSGDQVSVNAWNADIDNDGMLGFNGETIVSSSSITPTNSTLVLSGTTNVSTIALTNTNEYDLLYIFTSGTVTLVNTSSPSSSGDIKLLADTNKDLSTTTPTILIRKGTAWYEYGGGITNALNDIGNVTITSNSSGEVLKWNGAAWVNNTLSEAGISPTAGSSSLVTTGTISSGTWNGTAIADAYISSSSTWDAKQAALTFGIANTNAVKIDSATAADNDYAKITASGIEGRSYSEVKTDLSLNSVENTAVSTWAGTSNIITLGTISTGTWNGTAVADGYVSSASTWNAKQSALTFGIANTNTINIDSASAASGEYAKLTTTGIESKSFSEVKTDLSLNNVENTAISTFAGSSNITTVGTIGTGVWSGTAVGPTKGGTNQTTYTTGDILYASGSNTLSKLGIGSNEQVLTLTSGVPAWEDAGGGKALLGADSTEVTITGTTATQVKDVDFIKNTATLNVATLTIAARIKTSNAGTTGSLRVRLNGAVSDSLVLTTTSTSYEIKTGTIDTSGLTVGRHTLEIFMDDGSGDTITHDMLEVWGE
jgi:hypothetical protein